MKASFAKKILQNDLTNGKKPKIALFHYSGPPVISGVDFVIRDQARLFRLFNYKVEIVAGMAKQFRKDIPIHIIRRMSPNNKFVLKVRQELEKGYIPPLFYKLEKSLYESLKNYLITNNITICIIHNIMTRHYNLPLTAAFVRLIKEFPQIKFIAWVHDTIFSDLSYGKFDSNIIKTYPWSILTTPLDSLYYVCVSEFLKKNLLDTLARKWIKHLSVIPNGIDVAKFLGLSPQMRLFYQTIDGPKSDLIACIPVRAVPRKRLELGLYVTKTMVDRGINFKLILTANIDYKRPENHAYFMHLKDLVEELKLENHVHFLEDFIEKINLAKKTSTPISVNEVYLISDLLLFTSSLEGFGLPLLEAGLLHTPIFASDIPPFREIGTTNINYFPLDATAEKITDMILDRMKKMPQAYFYRKVIKKYSLQAIFQNQIIPLLLNKQN